MEILYPDDFIKYYDSDDSDDTMREYELLLPCNCELRDIDDDSYISEFKPFDYGFQNDYSLYDPLLQSIIYSQYAVNESIEIDEDSFRPPHGGGHFSGGHGGPGWHGGGSPGGWHGGGHSGWHGGSPSGWHGGGHGGWHGGSPVWHGPSWGGWYGPWLWPLLWPKYCPGPSCPCPGNDCPCPGPDCPCSGSDCPRTNFITSDDDSDGYRTVPKSIYDISNKIKNASGMVYDSFRPPVPSAPSPKNPSGTIGPPPSYIPSKNDKKVQFMTPQTSTLSGGAAPKSVSPGSIKFCLFKFTYIWQTNGRSYWAYLLRVDRQSISGFRWAGWRWVYFGVDLRRIEAFVC